MNARNFMILTFSTVVAIAVGAMACVLLGLEWKGGNEGVPWVLFAMPAVALGTLRRVPAKGVAGEGEGPAAACC